MWLQLDAEGPLYQQLYRALRRAILDGALLPGARLSATRSLAREAGVSRNTVLLAYEQLLDEGYVTARVGSGTFVAASLPEDPAPAPRPSGGSAGRRRLAGRDPSSPGPSAAFRFLPQLLS